MDEKAVNISDDWEKRQKARDKKIAMLKKHLPDNSIVKRLRSDVDKEKIAQHDVMWDVVHDAVFKAQQNTIEGDLSVDKALKELCEVINACLGKYRDEVKDLASKVGY